MNNLGDASRDYDVCRHIYSTSHFLNFNLNVWLRIQDVKLLFKFDLTNVKAKRLTIGSVL